MKNKQTHYFLLPYSVLLIAMIWAIATISKSELHLQMNSFHSNFFDAFFKYFTEIGGGTIPFVLIGIILFYRYSIALYLLSAQLLGGIISFVAKRFFAEPRPFDYFMQNFPDIQLPIVEGVKIYHSFSFPSGHTITAFAFFLGLSLIIKNRWWNLFFFFLASLVAFSRVYLSQHFAIDITVGSVIGTITALICYPLYIRMNLKWNNQSLMSTLKKLNKKEK